MADYKRMYLRLLDEIVYVIDKLKIAVERAENIYIDSGDDADDVGTHDENPV